MDVKKKTELMSGADLGFFRGGGGGFSNNFRKFCRPFFFRLSKVIFRALPNHLKDPVLVKLSAPQKKQDKQRIEGRF